MTEDGQTWNLYGLLIRLNDAYNKARNEYVSALFDGAYDKAAEKLTNMELIEMHINKVEEL